jgi:hypothetical protein
MTSPKPLRIFCSYAHEDEEHLDELHTSLRGLERQGLIEWWHDREIVPGRRPVAACLTRPAWFSFARL